MKTLPAGGAGGVCAPASGGAPAAAAPVNTAASAAARGEGEGARVAGRGGTEAGAGALRCRMIALVLDGDDACYSLAASLFKRNFYLFTERTVSNAKVLRKLLEIPILPIL